MAEQELPTTSPASNPVGRPLTYKTKEDLLVVIEDYFDWCDNRTKSVYIKDLGDNMEISSPAPYTMSGLARRIGLSRQALSEYSHKEEFGDAIKDARDRVQEDIETRLMETTNQSGAIFNLKNNFGWKDKNETDLTTNGKDMNPVLVKFVGDDDSTNN